MRFWVHVRMLHCMSVATICAMSASSVKTLKLLGATRQYAFFKFGIDIVAVYDPPHF
jgi:hypothetical protein